MHQSAASAARGPNEKHCERPPQITKYRPQRSADGLIIGLAVTHRSLHVKVCRFLLDTSSAPKCQAVLHQAWVSCPQPDGTYHPRAARQQGAHQSQCRCWQTGLQRHDLQVQAGWPWKMTALRRCRPQSRLLAQLHQAAALAAAAP